MGAGKVLELAGAGNLFLHVREFGRAVHQVAERMGFHHKLGEFDVVDGSRPVGQLHTGLKSAVTLAWHRQLPTPVELVVALDGKGLAAHAAGRRQGSQGRIARHRVFQGDAGKPVNQRVEQRLFFGHRQGKARQLQRCVVQYGFHATRVVDCAAGWRGRRLARQISPRQPPAVQANRKQKQATSQCQRQLQGTNVHQAALASVIAASMSTTTMRETPCSCMVTPMSCSAISMAILLWLMNKNWVSRLMRATRRA